MRIDLHNHTFFCNHAKGSMEEYVKKAIELKIDTFGFLLRWVAVAFILVFLWFVLNFGK